MKWPAEVEVSDATFGGFSTCTNTPLQLLPTATTVLTYLYSYDTYVLRTNYEGLRPGVCLVRQLPLTMLGGPYRCEMPFSVRLWPHLVCQRSLGIGYR